MISVAYQTTDDDDPTVQEGLTVAITSAIVSFEKLRYYGSQIDHAIVHATGTLEEIHQHLAKLLTLIKEWLAHAAELRHAIHAYNMRAVDTRVDEFLSCVSAAETTAKTIRESLAIN